jgi:hypothetical protein
VNDIGNSRQARRRLTRNRPSPRVIRTVRTRASRPAPEGANRTWRHVDWTRIGTVAGVIAGIGTLLFTGIATYFGAMVSRNQLEQSRQDAAQKARDQAARVSTWVDYSPDGDIQLHVMNRSPDPVSSVDMLFEAVIGDYEHTELLVTYSLGLPDLPPCSDMVFDPGTWKYRRYRDKTETYPESPIAALPSADGWMRQPQPDRLDVVYLRFTDRSGKVWWRDYGKLRSGAMPDSFASGDADTHGLGGFTRIAKVQRTAGCADS